MEKKITEMNEKIAEGVTKGYKKIEEKFTETFLNEDGSMKTGKVGDAVVDGYRKIEDGVVSGFTKMTDKIVGKFLTREGETVEEAKARMNTNTTPEK